MHIFPYCSRCILSLFISTCKCTCTICRCIDVNEQLSKFWMRLYFHSLLIFNMVMQLGDCSSRDTHKSSCSADKNTWNWVILCLCDGIAFQTSSSSELQQYKASHVCYSNRHAVRSAKTLYKILYFCWVCKVKWHMVSLCQSKVSINPLGGHKAAI